MIIGNFYGKYLLKNNNIYEKFRLKNLKLLILYILLFCNKNIILYILGIIHKEKKMPDKALEYLVQALPLVPEGDPIEKEIEEEINKIYKSKLSN
jgi:hypothetical protein